MGLQKVPIAILTSELSTLDDPKGVIPWRWNKFAVMMDFPEGTYPENGVTNLPMTHLDYQGIASTKTDYDALMSFYAAVKDAITAKDKKKLELITASGKETNPVLKGLKIYRAFFTRISRRAKLNESFDEFLGDNDMKPWQFAKALDLEWPKDKGELKLKDAFVPRQADLALEIFGQGALKTTFLIDPFAQKILHSMMYASWDRNGKCWPRWHRKLEELKEKSDKSWNEICTLGEDVPKKERLQKLRGFIKEVRSRCDLSKQLGDEGMEEAEKMEQEVKDLIEAAKGKGTSGMTAKMKGLAELLKTLLSPEEIRDMEDMYGEAFLQENDDASEEVLGDLTSDYPWMDNSGDLGVAEFKSYSVEMVKKLLHLPSGNFPFFNNLVSDFGAIPSQIPGFFALNDRSNIDNAEITDEMLAEKGLRRLAPRWHQYVGLAASVKRFFKGENVILADGVGVGKTMQSIMMMAYLRHLTVTKVKSSNIPLAVKAKTESKSKYDEPHWGWGSTVECYPSGSVLVVVPNPLATQWHAEARRILDSRFWNIILYPNLAKQRELFWKDVWEEKIDTGNKKGITTILIVSHSAMRAEASAVIRPKSTRLLDPAVGPELLATDNTVFAQKWSLAVWDEAQHLRTENHLSRAAHAIRVRCGSMVLASATPLHNSERDLVSLALAAGMSARLELIEAESKLRRKLASVARETPITGKASATKSLMQGASSLPMAGTREAGQLDARKEHVAHIRNYFASVVIRRRHDSVDNEGNLISGLPVLKKFTINITMSAEEYEKFEIIKQETLEKMTSVINPASLPTKTFFSEYRIAVGHSGFYQGKAPPLYTTRADFVKNRSAKWAVITKLVLSILNAPNEETYPVSGEDGHIIYPRLSNGEDMEVDSEANNSEQTSWDPEEQLSDKLDKWDRENREDLVAGKEVTHWPLSENPNSKSKIIIYVEFVKPLQYLIDGLQLSGVKCLAATGTKKRVNGHEYAREEAIRRFKSRSYNYRVLFLSSVGSAGLNLHEARFMIFADTVWSGQSEEQIIGRMYRQPNTQQCAVYFPRVLGTSDDVLTQMGRSKEALLDIFYCESSRGADIWKRTWYANGRFAAGGNDFVDKAEESSGEEIELESEDDEEVFASKKGKAKPKQPKVPKDPKQPAKSRVKKEVGSSKAKEAKGKASSLVGDGEPSSVIPETEAPTENLKKTRAMKPKAQTKPRGRKKSAPEISEEKDQEMDIDVGANTMSTGGTEQTIAPSGVKFIKPGPNNSLQDAAPPEPNADAASSKVSTSKAPIPPAKDLFDDDVIVTNARGKESTVTVEEARESPGAESKKRRANVISIMAEIAKNAKEQKAKRAMAQKVRNTVGKSTTGDEDEEPDQSTDNSPNESKKLANNVGTLTTPDGISGSVRALSLGENKDDQIVEFPPALSLSDSIEDLNGGGMAFANATFGGSSQQSDFEDVLQLTDKDLQQAMDAVEQPRQTRARSSSNLSAATTQSPGPEKKRQRTGEQRTGSAARSLEPSSNFFDLLGRSAKPVTGLNDLLGEKATKPPGKRR